MEDNTKIYKRQYKRRSFAKCMNRGILTWKKTMKTNEFGTKSMGIEILKIYVLQCFVGYFDLTSYKICCYSRSTLVTVHFRWHLRIYMYL